MVRAAVTAINLPEYLQAGDKIKGTVKIVNVGATAGIVGLLLTAIWSGESFRWAYIERLPGQGFEAIVSGQLSMPAQDASMRLEGQHLDMTTLKWVTDDVKTH